MKPMNGVFWFLCVLLAAPLAAAATSTSSSTTSTSSSAKVPSALSVPPQDDSTRAYAFRTQLSGNPQCQQFATRADEAFLSTRLSIAEKAAQLKQIEAEAKAAGCIQS